jgi:hypothetical protein
MPNGDTITTASGRRIRLVDVNLRVPYSMYCTLYNCSFEHLEYMLQNFRPREQQHLELRFLQPVSRLVAGSSITLFEHTFPRIGPVVVQSGIDAATTFFRSGNPNWNATGSIDLRTRVWGELHFFANGEVQVNGSAHGLELDHGQFMFGFRLQR